jgi:hypothetical protein
MSNTIVIEEKFVVSSLQKLLKAVADITFVKSVVFDNKHYFENGSCCQYFESDSQREDYDPYIYCLNHDEEKCKFSDADMKILKEYKVFVPSHKFNLMYPEIRNKFDKKELVSYNINIEKDDDLQTIDFTDVDISIFKEYLHLVNLKGINHDHRGSNHCHLQLKFHMFYILGNLFTFHDLAEAVYKTKSHKFNNNYEMFYGYSNMVIQKDRIYCTLGFDHGS